MRYWLRGILSLIVANVFLFVELTVPAFAEVKLPTGREEEFSQNNILFYNPDGGLNCNYASSSSSSSGSGGSVDSSSVTEKLKEVVREYGEFAMDLQRKYGSPWEVVFAQMVVESGVGTCTDCVASAIAENGYFNWLGITGDGGSFGVGTPYISSSGRAWAQFATIENMMEGWAGPLVLRNGYYDDAFQELDPNNFNLHEFLVKMISHYAPNSDGNNESDYVAKVESYISGPIEEVRQEMGWPSSEELAKSENIQIGGSEGMGSSEGGSSSSSSSSLQAECSSNGLSSGSYGNIQEYVLGYAWPQYHNAPYLEKTQAYEDAVNRRQGAGQYIGGINYPGIDCGGFVTTLLQDSGYDPNYNDEKCRTGCQEKYVKRQGWESVTDTNQLQPGDVAFTDGHTWVYVGEVPGFESVVASASLDERAPMAGHEGVEGARWYHKPGGSSASSSENNEGSGEINE